jgi:hypothetical protein
MPPRLAQGAEELRAEGTGQEILLQVRAWTWKHSIMCNDACTWLSNMSRKHESVELGRELSLDGASAGASSACSALAYSCSGAGSL